MALAVKVNMHPPALRHRKAAPTPQRFPRRAGMAAKRPLGGAGARAGCVALPVNGGKDGVGLERGWSARSRLAAAA